MKITKEELQQIIKEEISKIINEENAPISSLYPPPTGTSPADRIDFDEYQTHQKNMQAFSDAEGKQADEDPERFLDWTEENNIKAPNSVSTYRRTIELNRQYDLERSYRHASASDAALKNMPKRTTFGDKLRNLSMKRGK